jgi:putative membrane protein
MHTGKRYSPLEFFKWTKKATFYLFLISTVATVLYYLGWKFLALPWQPVAVMATVVAFIV